MASCKYIFSGFYKDRCFFNGGWGCILGNSDSIFNFLRSAIPDSE